uniref:Phospholipid-binding lipoprotein MlaA n=1 Tax=Candidatus Kentrum sp. TUN TaxID=2126343 RepID=A0A450ZKJ0_9GAMM|nr:MAG: phospholipid-binding lipoprotein MlaA [Candidatus Kentron sp. TUN]VFK56261.1 MAG: phospholipid-binding lipoprotein MlaA [Candidatus Kentron sp. TUN]
MNGKNRPGIEIILFLLLCLLANGSIRAEGHEKGNDDPLEGMNRVFYGVNDVPDKMLIEPVAEIYADHVPATIQSGISNFFDNLAYPGVIVNDILQGKIRDGFEDTWRFIVNTVFGIGGIFDPATHLGLERHKEDFGQTLATWGAGEGAYLVIPVVGSNSVRHAPGLVMGFFTNLLYYAEASVIFPLAIVNAIDRRADFLGVTHLRDGSMLDPYLFTRDAYRQRRTYLIHDGEPPYEYDEYDEEVGTSHEYEEDSHSNTTFTSQ